MAKKFDDLIVEVLKVIDNAQKEIYFATRYHDQHVSSRVFEKFGKGVSIHILDGNPEQISVENRLAAIIRTPPNRGTAELVKKITISSRFDLKRLPDLPVSFMVVDGIQVVRKNELLFIIFGNSEILYRIAEKLAKKRHLS